jgi:hypothetical protein
MERRWLGVSLGEFFLVIVIAAVAAALLVPISKRAPSPANPPKPKAAQNAEP